jgi:Protein of unknown function (DUF2652)
VPCVGNLQHSIFGGWLALGNAQEDSIVTRQEAPSAASGQLLLADISGYTSFLQSVALAHKDDAFADGAVPPAYAVLSNLLDGIVGRLVPPFTLSELEGDAVFAYAANSDPVPRGAAMLDCLTECYADFRRRVGAALDIWPCGCDACTRIYVLDLKFILHDGAFVTQEIAGKRKLVGPEVVMAHRLLKNNAAELVGHSAYALVTSAAAARLDIPTEDGVPIAESYEHYAPISAHVFPLREA